MKVRKIITSIISVLLIAIAVYILTQVQLEVQRAANRLELGPLSINSIISAMLFTFIAFMATKNWFEYFIAGNIKVDIKFLIPGIALFLFGLIPIQAWVIWFGLRFNLVFISSYGHSAVNMLAGILIGRSLQTRLPANDC